MLGQQVQQALVTLAPEMHTQGAPSTAVQHERCSATCHYLVLHTVICNIAENIKRMYQACESIYQEQGISIYTKNPMRECKLQRAHPNKSRPTQLDTLKRDTKTAWLSLSPPRANTSCPRLFRYDSPLPIPACTSMLRLYMSCPFTISMSHQHQHKLNAKPVVVYVCHMLCSLLGDTLQPAVLAKHSMKAHDHSPYCS